MSRLATVVVVPALLALASPGLAAPHRVLVLPLDGTADAPTRARLDAEVAKLARELDGRVERGSTSFPDAAAAVGCDPHAPPCAQQVREMLAVDELVWGTADQDGPRTRVVVHRASRGGPPRDATATLAAQERASFPGLFGEPHAPPPSTVSEPAPSVVRRRAPAPEEPTRTEGRPNRTLGIAALAGGGLAVAIGVALWTSESDLQHQIDAHPTATRADFDALRSLESRASRDALWGNVLVVAGGAVALGGGYLLYRDHRALRIAPHPIEHGAAVTLTIGGAP